MATPKTFSLWRASRNFDTFDDFSFQKIQHKVLYLEIQLLLSMLWVWYLKIGAKSKKLSESVKNDAKAKIARD